MLAVAGGAVAREVVGYTDCKWWRCLGVKLGMPVHESGGIVDRPEMGLGGEAGVDHMQSTVGLVWRALLVCLFLLVLLAAAGWVGR